MIEYFILIILFILISDQHPTKIIFKNLIKNNDKYALVLSSLPYYYEFNDDKISSLYHYINLISNSGRKDDYITIKLLWFKNNNSINLNKLEKLISYANDRNIKVGISSYLKKYKSEEINTYLRVLNKGYKNIFITLATYHKDIDESVDLILKNNGQIRLVKGWWYDGDIKNWDKVTEKYYSNAKKLIDDKKNHILATHDFNIIKKLFDEYKKLDHIEFSFFMFNKKFVERQIKLLPYKIKKKSLYKMYGSNILNLPLTIFYSNFYKNSELFVKSFF